MDSRDKTDQGVIHAATMLQVMAAPFILVTVITVSGLFFVPLWLALTEMSGDAFTNERFVIYGICLAAMVFSFIVSNVMMTMATMMKANHLDTEHRKSPKSRLWELCDLLLFLVHLELIVGSILGLLCVSLQEMLSEYSFQLSGAIFFLFVLIIAGLFVLVARKFLMKMDWWSRS